QSSMWGLGKVVSIEHPELKCLRVDLPLTGEDREELRSLLKEIESPRTGHWEDQVVLEGADRYVARLVRSQSIVRRNEHGKPFCGSSGCYLITGGLNGIGLRAARMFVEQGARHLVLVGRRGMTPEAKE